MSGTSRHRRALQPGMTRMFVTAVPRLGRWSAVSWAGCRALWSGSPALTGGPMWSWSRRQDRVDQPSSTSALPGTCLSRSVASGARQLPPAGPDGDSAARYKNDDLGVRPGQVSIHQGRKPPERRLERRGMRTRSRESEPARFPVTLEFGAGLPSHLLPAVPADVPVDKVGRTPEDVSTAVELRWRLRNSDQEPWNWTSGPDRAAAG
jgi:hypothetical protein